MREEGKRRPPYMKMSLPRVPHLPLIPHPLSLVPHRGHRRSNQSIVVATALIPITADVVTSLVQC